MSRVGVHLLAGLCLVWLAAAPASAQDFERGLTAARAGDFATAMAEWRPLAESGHAEAQYNLGLIYEAGLGIEADARAAATWYARAAAQDHARAQYNLGVMYADGRGVPRDDARAAEYFRRSAVLGYAKAQYNLGILYQTGRGLPRDPTQARIWFDRAAANGVAGPRATPPEQPASESTREAAEPAPARERNAVAPNPVVPKPTPPAPPIRAPAELEPIAPGQRSDATPQADTTADWTCWAFQCSIASIW